MMVSWRSWLARLLNNSDPIRSLGLTEEVAGSNRQKSFFLPPPEAYNFLLLSLDGIHNHWHRTQHEPEKGVTGMEGYHSFLFWRWSRSGLRCGLASRSSSFLTNIRSISGFQQATAFLSPKKSAPKVALTPAPSSSCCKISFKSENDGEVEEALVVRPSSRSSKSRHSEEEVVEEVSKKGSSCNGRLSRNDIGKRSGRHRGSGGSRVPFDGRSAPLLAKSNG